MQTLWQISISAPPSPERIRFSVKFGAEQKWPQHSGSFCSAEHPSWRCNEPNSRSHSQRICTYSALASGCVPWSDQTQCTGIASTPPPSSQRLSHGPSRLGSMSGSVLLGSSALTFEMWLGHYTAQMAYICIWKILGFPWWKQCIAATPEPLQFAKTCLQVQAAEVSCSN